MFGLTLLAMLMLGAFPGQASTSPPPIADSGTDQSDSSLPTGQVNFDVDGGGGTIGVGVALPAGASTSTGGAGSRPRCTWEKVLAGDFRDTPGVTPGEGVRPTDQISELGADGEVTRSGWWKTCGTAGAQFVWVAATVDIQVLIDGAAARARAATPRPVPQINPAPEVGSFVNLGLWLAIEDPGLTVARVDLGGQWAQVQATHTGFEVNLGNGDVVTCDATGTPIADLDSVEEGPCGYTYRLSSPDEAPYQVTITSTYAVTYSTSTGRSGSLGGLTRSSSFSYDVDEVQTVGVSN